MRIAVVTSQFPIAGEPTRGRPIAQTLRELAREAELRVFVPTAVYPRWALPRSYTFRPPAPDAASAGLDVEFASYPVLPLVSRPFNGVMCARALAQPVAAYKPDVVLSYWLYPDAYGAMRVALRERVPFVAGARGSDLRVRDAVSRRLTRPVVRRADRLLVVSADLARLAVEAYGAQAERVRVIPNGCDASVFKRGDRAAARGALALDATSRIVLYVGRLVPEKGLRELVQACEALAANDPRLVLVMVGGGPMQPELERLAAASNGRLRLVGALAPVEVARWMVASDLLALPSYSEGHPNVLVEALACGLPVVSTPVGGIPEVVDAESAVLVPPRDARALGDGIAAALARQWDTAALTRRFSRDWRSVAADTLRACEDARSSSRAQAH